MRKIAIVLSLMLLASVAGGGNRSIIDREDLSLKAGPTEPGEGLSLVWLESYVYPKVVKEERVISLGISATSRIESVTAYFDFSRDKVSLTSDDGVYWSGIYEIGEDVAAGLHVVRYGIKGGKAGIRRTVEFFIEDSTKKKQKVAQGEVMRVRSWPLTVTSTGTALAGESSRILYTGQKVIGIAKVPWYKVVFEDGEEGWVPATMVKEPLKEYYQLGYEAYLNKNYSAALEYYKNTIAINPDLVKGYFWLAKIYYQQGDFESAYRSIMEAMRMDERNIDSKIFGGMLAQEYFKMARVKFRSSRYHEAVAAYQKVIELKPNSVLSWIEIGKCYAKLDLPFEARFAWREALKIDPENKEIHALLNIDFSPTAMAKAAKKALTTPERELPPVLVDDSLEIVKESKTRKGTKIESALKSVIALAKSLGTPVIEKGWQIKKQGEEYLARYLCEQGSGVLEAFEWKVNIDTKRVIASNANARILMDRW